MADILKAILVAHVRKFATDNYEKDGWDFLVECWSDADIADAIGSADTTNEAVRRCRRSVKLMNERRTEIQNA